MGRNFGRVAAACLALAVVSASAREAQDWTLVDLGTLGGPGSYGAALNDHGTVVGCADVDATSAHAFVYGDGAMHDLGLGSDSAVGHSCALAVNDNGVVAGRAASGELVTWDGSALIPLGVKGNIGGINDAGVVVGAYTEGASTRAFMYANGAVTALGTAASSVASAINARGEIAGASDGQAFVYRGGALVALGTLGGNRSEAKGINDAGQLVGMSTDANGQPLSFLYESAMQALQAPSYSGAVAINDRGQVVGSSEGTHGYLIEAGAHDRPPNPAPRVAKGLRHMEPTGIKNMGWIVGTGTDPHGNLRAFLLVPPTPKVEMRLTRLAVSAAPTTRRSPP